MNTRQVRRGGAAVGYVAELDPVEAGAVMYLRLWNDAPDARDQMRQDLSMVLGEEPGRSALEAFAGICELCARHGRRPLMRHSLACKCLGADESCFANFIGYASDGAREDAFLIAAHMVRPDMAAVLVGMAEQFGLALKRMALQASRLPQTQPINTTVH